MMPTVPSTATGADGSLAGMLSARAARFVARETHVGARPAFMPAKRADCANDTTPTHTDEDALEAASVAPGWEASTAEPTEMELARIDAFAAGIEEGRARTEAAMGATLAECARLAEAIAAARAIEPAELAATLADAVHTLVAQLLDEVPDLAGHGIGARARRAVDLVARAQEPATLWLAPADAALLAPEFADGSVAIVPDPTLARGALRLTTRYSRLDDSPRQRLDQIAPALREAALTASTANDDGPGIGPDNRMGGQA